MRSTTVAATCLRTAIIGAGCLGSLAAARLVRLGHAVTVFDRGTDWWSGASGVGEGKVHLGYVYLRASESFLETTVGAALAFRDGVEEAVGRRLDWAAIRGADFVYQFGAGSEFGPSELGRHAERLAGIAARLVARQGSEYLGTAIERHTLATLQADPCGLRTPEACIDVPALRREVVAAVAAMPAIGVRFGVEITDATRQAAGWMLRMHGHDASAATEEGPFDLVVNCSWDGAERLDSVALGRPPRRLNYRLRQYLSGVSPDPPLARTIVHGAFGDYASFPQGRVYMTWYPAGLLGFVVGAEPPADWRRQAMERPASPAEIASVVEQLSRYVPQAARVRDVSVAARVVVAAGETDITDARSDLHDREVVVIEETAGWIRPRSPKLSTAPYASMLLADHVRRHHA
jgi:glycine/D-amino acid oxidase-like deaminating enzyme